MSILFICQINHFQILNHIENIQHKSEKRLIINSYKVSWLFFFFVYIAFKNHRLMSVYLNRNSKLILMGTKRSESLAGENEIAPYSLRAAKFAVLSLSLSLSQGKSQNTGKRSACRGRETDRRLFILLRWNRDVEHTVVLWEVGKAREEDEKEWERPRHE